LEWQGKRISASQHMQEIGIIPSGPRAFGRDAALGGVVAAQQIERDVAQRREVPDIRQQVWVRADLGTNTLSSRGRVKTPRRRWRHWRPVADARRSQPQWNGACDLPGKTAAM